MIDVEFRFSTNVSCSFTITALFLTLKRILKIFEVIFTHVDEDANNLRFFEEITSKLVNSAANVENI